MDAHVAVPSRSVVESFSTDWAFFSLLWVSHSSCLEFLHVIVQLHLCLNFCNLYKVKGWDAYSAYINICHGCLRVAEIKTLRGAGGDALCCRRALVGFVAIFYG